MNIALHKPMTVAEFLAWEERQELRWEFNGYEPVAMNGGTAAHSMIQLNLLTALKARLRGTPCQPHGSSLKIEVAGRIRYPDAFVVCTPVPPRSKVVTDPVVVLEILSPSTQRVDLTEKNAEYRATPSIQRYVVLQQDCAAAISFIRKGEEWVSELRYDTDAVLDLPEIGTEVPLAEIYEGVTLPGPGEEVPEEG